MFQRLQHENLSNVCFANSYEVTSTKFSRSLVREFATGGGASLFLVSSICTLFKSKSAKYTPPLYGGQFIMNRKGAWEILICMPVAGYLRLP